MRTGAIGGHRRPSGAIGGHRLRRWPQLSGGHLQNIELSCAWGPNTPNFHVLQPYVGLQNSGFSCARAHRQGVYGIAVAAPCGIPTHRIVMCVGPQNTQFSCAQAWSGLQNTGFSCARALFGIPKHRIFTCSGLVRGADTLNFHVLRSGLGPHKQG